MAGLTSSVAGMILAAVTGGMGLPFGVPPGPDDPALARVAPAQCLFCMSWAGAVAPDPQSRNQTEQLLAEPEVQDFLAQTGRWIHSGMHARAEANAKDAETTHLALEAVDAMLDSTTRPGVVFLSSFSFRQPTKNETPGKGDAKPAGKEADAVKTAGPEVMEFEGGLVLSLGKDAAGFKALIEKCGKVALNAEIKIVKIDGQDWRRSKFAPDMPCVTYGFHESYFILAFGEKGVENILARMKGAPSKLWAALPEQLPIARRSAAAYVNVRDVAKLILSRLDSDDRVQARAVLDMLGLSNVTELVETWGLDGEDFTNRTLLRLDGEPRGLLRLISNTPLKLEDVTAIPRDSTLAAALRVHPQQALKIVLSSLEKLNPQLRADATAAIEEWERSLGVDLRHGTLAALGDTWCVYNSPHEGGLVMTGLTAVVPLRDWAGMNMAYGRAMAAAKQLAPPRTEPKAGDDVSPEIVRFPFMGSEVYYLNSTGGFSPAWCMTKREMLFSLSPHNVKSYLARDQRHEPIHRLPQVANLFADGNGPSLVAYADTPRLFEMVYPLVVLYWPAVRDQIEPAPAAADLLLLPSALSINRHLGPSVAVLRRTKHGIELFSRGTVPLPNLTFFAELWAAVWVRDTIRGYQPPDGEPAPNVTDIRRPGAAGRGSRLATLSAASDRRDPKRYLRMPVLGPIAPGKSDEGIDRPSDDEVMRALELARPASGGLFFRPQFQRKNVRIAVEPLTDNIDPPREFPLVGAAQLHHLHYKCMVRYTEVAPSSVAATRARADEEAQEVIYVDHDHLHLVEKTKEVDARPVGGEIHE